MRNDRRVLHGAGMLGIEAEAPGVLAKPRQPEARVATLPAITGPAPRTTAHIDGTARLAALRLVPRHPATGRILRVRMSARNGHRAAAARLLGLWAGA